MTSPQVRDVTPLPPPSRPSRLLNLRLKFVLFFSLILILTCSALSWYFIENRRSAMIDNLRQVGTILLANLVNNQHFRFAGLVAEDLETLQQFVNGLMAVQDVVYVVITKTDGSVLIRETKGSQRTSGSLVRDPANPLYPGPSLVTSLMDPSITAPHMTSFSQITRLGNRFAWEEHLYDFGMPVLTTAPPDSSLETFSLQMEEGRGKSSSQPVHISAVVQIGLTDAHLKQELVTMVRNIMIMTMVIIAAGILGALFLTQRITIPLRKLAGFARQLAAGETPPALPSSTRDEVGQLTRMFNLMNLALQERNAAITSNMDTIRRQLSELKTIHDTSAVITGTLDLQELLNTVLQLLMTNLGFSRMLLMLRDEDREMAYVAQVAGVSEDIAESARYLTIPIQDGDTLIAELFIRATPLLVTDIDEVAHRMHPAILALAKRVGVTSFVLVPLQSHNRTLGFLGADRGTRICSGEDLNVLLTVASHVASAIDNARTYGDLAQLTQNLEYRIQERTKELSVVNERLKEHDHRRSIFFSVASHELRTPMTAIRSFADNMLDGVAGPLTERQTTYLNRIGHNLTRLTRIINQLLDWSRLDLKKEVLHLEPICIGQVAGLVAESLRTVASEKSVAITVNGQDQLPTIQADRDKMEQIFWNLIGNAVKFTPPGGQVNVEVTAPQENQVQARIADTGCGIPPDYLHKIFEEFSKVPSTMPTSQGAQLGLFITKNLIEMHQGTIDVESTVNVGTTFTVTFPYSLGEDKRDKT